MKNRIFRFIEGKLTEKETEELFTNLNQSEDAKREYIEILNFKALRNAQRKRMNGKKYMIPQNTITHKRMIFALSAACIVVLYLGASKLYTHYREEKAIQQIVAITTNRQIAASETQAILELATGKKIDLHGNSAEAASLTEQKSTKQQNTYNKENSKKTENRETVKNRETITTSMDIIHPGTTGNQAEIAVKPLNTINITGNKDYLLTLHDGSKVWLRPNTKFSFPDKFEHGKRYVELEGEAYFSIAKDSLQPFIIKSSEMEIKVLGTEFNLLSVKGTSHELSMVSGVVSLSVPNLNRIIKLKANQQAIINSMGELSFKKMDGYKYKAWTEGYFVFINQNLYSIIQELHQWYKIDIEILNNKYNDEPFNGKFSADKGLDQVIKNLQLSYGFNFYVKDNILYIK